MNCKFCGKELKKFQKPHTEIENGLVHTNCYLVMSFIKNNISVVKKYIKEIT